MFDMFDDFESVVIREIEKYLSRENTNSSFYHGEFRDSLILRWISPTSTNIVFTITINRMKNELSFALWENYEDYEKITVDIPKSEEEHFQINTVKNLLFSWNFYVYVNDLMWKIRNS